MTSRGRTSLSRTAYEEALTDALRIIKRDGRVTNRTLRSGTGLNYDQVIKFFNTASSEGVLIRLGRAGGTHYALPDTRDG